MRQANPSRFVIISMSRSGTSLLSESLNSHPQIVCHGEVFHPNPVGHLKDNFIEQSFDQVVQLRAENPSAFLDWVFDRPGVTAAGFKMWQSQNPDGCDSLLADHSVAKIIYERPNVLARFSSSLLVRTTGVYNLGADKKRSTGLDQRVAFDLRQFRAYLAKHRETFLDLRQRARGRVLDLTYTDLLSSGFADVQAFLGVSRQDLALQKQKLHGSDILRRFDDSHHDAIRAELGRIGHEDWWLE